MVHFQDKLWSELIEDKQDRLETQGLYKSTSSIKDFHDFEECCSQISLLTSRGRTNQHITRFFVSLRNLQAFITIVQSVVHNEQVPLVIWSCARAALEVRQNTTTV